MWIECLKESILCLDKIRKYEIGSNVFKACSINNPKQRQIRVWGLADTNYYM